MHFGLPQVANSGMKKTPRFSWGFSERVGIKGDFLGKHLSRARKSPRPENATLLATLHLRLTPSTCPQPEYAASHHALCNFHIPHPLSSLPHCHPTELHPNSRQLEGRGMTSRDMQPQNGFLGAGGSRIHRIPWRGRSARQRRARRITSIQTSLLILKA